MIKSIDTFYNGDYFRSRLEARWAAFFTILRIKYKYEPEGYVTTEGCYLPDFWLPQFNCFAEVKPIELNGTILQDDQIYHHSDFEKWLAFTDQISKPLLLLCGKPNTKALPLISRTVTPTESFNDYAGENFIDYVYFCNEGKTDPPNWRLWINERFDKDFYWFKEAITLANIKRFEHNYD